uniref:thiolase family protein n=1 Tax=Vibrio cholerae TaxID=666 RepID=UPI003F582A96
MGAFEVKDLLIHDGLTDVFNQYHMGVTAENIAKQYDIARQTQDEFALASQMKATAAIEAGHFKREIVPISVKKRRETVVFDTDEYPNRRPRWQHCKVYAPRSMRKVRLPQVMLLELTMVPVR